MVPSGEWRGYWEQAHWGRQPMHDLVLTVANGGISGSGKDVIGSFTFEGSYDASGTVLLLKHYHKKHDVIYRGRYDGEGTIIGEWTVMDQWRGPFVLSLKRFEVPADAEILSISADES